MHAAELTAKRGEWHEPKIDRKTGISKDSVEMFGTDQQPGQSRHLAPAENPFQEVWLPFAGDVLQDGNSSSQSEGAGRWTGAAGMPVEQVSPLFLEPCGFPYHTMRRYCCPPSRSAGSGSLGSVDSTAITEKIADLL